jgi:hypothetical protein
MNSPLHIHTRSCKKSNVMGPSKYFGIKYLFSFLHPYSKGDLGGGLASLACVHTYIWNATRSMLANILPVAHSLTGCDTTSSFFGIGKKTVYKILKQNTTKYQTSLACVHTYTWNATRSMCCLNAGSDGGSLTREESFDKANFSSSCPSNCR